MKTKVSKLKIRLFIPVDAMIWREKFLLFCCDFSVEGVVVGKWKVESQRACEIFCRKITLFVGLTAAKKLVYVRRGGKIRSIKLNYSSKVILN